MAERDIPFEVRELQYVEVDPAELDRLRRSLRNEWGFQIPIVPCVRCGRYMDDPNRDIAGERMHENPEDDDLEPTCSDCLAEQVGAALREDVVQVIDETLGLGETDRKAIKAFIETIFTDPQKILQVRDLNNRVRYLEEQNKLLWQVLIGAIIVMLIALLAALL